MAVPMWFRTIASVLFFIALLLSWVVAWLLQVILIAGMYFFYTKKQRQYACGWLFRTLSMLLCDKLNPIWNVKTVSVSEKKVSPDVPTIYMFNHLSNCDPWLCIRAIWPVDCKWVAKGSLFKVPFGGWCLGNNGDIAVKFTAEKDGWGTEKGSVRSMMEHSAQLLRDHYPIAIFPEGVRSFNPEGPIGEFKDGFFILAIQEKATIVPVAISGTDKLWPRKAWQMNFGTSYQSVGAPISAEGHTVETLKKAVYDAMTEMREKHPDRLKNKSN